MKGVKRGQGKSKRQVDESRGFSNAKRKGGKVERGVRLDTDHEGLDGVDMCEGA